MVDSTKPYLSIIRESLVYALNLRNFPSMIYEKINRLERENEYLKSYNEFLFAENKILKECLLNSKPTDNGEFLLNP